MLLTAQRSSVHGRDRAQLEWQRIVELALRCGLGALPAARPEFGPSASSRQTAADQRPVETT